MIGFRALLVVGAAALAATAAATANPSQAQQRTCSVTPSGPVEIPSGDVVGFMGGSACAGHTVVVSPKGGTAGFSDNCTETTHEIASQGGFFILGCEVGEAEAAIYDGSTLVQTIDLVVVPQT